MKTAFLKFLPIAAAVMLATSCSKDDNDNAPATQSGRGGVETVTANTIPFSIRVNTGHSLKKMAYENGTEVGSYQPKFEQSDEGNLTMIIKDGDDVIGNLTLDDAKTATFSGDLTQQPSSNASLTAEISVSGSKNSSDKSLQDLLATCAHRFLGTFTYGAAEVDLTDQTSYLAITLPSDETTVNVNGNECALKDGKVWVAFNSSEKVHSARLSLFNKQADPGTIYTVTRGKSTFVAKEFTVADDGNGNVKKVYFSPGNLLYQASCNKWEFAAHQYDICHVSGDNVGDDYANWTGKWTDLFGWVGASSKFDGAAIYGVSTSTTPFDYGNVVGEALKSDWGKVFGENSNWYTLTTEEFRYLFSYDTYTNDTRANKYGEGIVAGVNGVILFPDDWTYPTLSESSTSEDKFQLGESDWVNTYTADDWAKMEANGAVFLPAAGSRYGTDVVGVGGSGLYWSSSAYIGGTTASDLSFLSGDVGPNYAADSRFGFSVRLVRAAL